MSRATPFWREVCYWGIGCLLSGTFPAQAADATWNYAVQAHATVSTSPARITLSWVEDTTPGRNGYVPSYTIARKAPGEAAWGSPQSVSAGQTTWTDANVQPGVAYEYQLVRVFADPAVPDWDHAAYGYLLSGINVPFSDQRGRVILVVEQTIADDLTDRVQRLRSDLVGDGWLVTQVNVNRNDTPASVRDRIRSVGASSGAVVLLGRVPIAKAGNYAPDFHEDRAMPTDAYYGDVDGNWVDADRNGVFEGDEIPSDIELAVGRIDFAELGGIGAGLDEVPLTARYLDKDHAFRHAALRFDRRALIGDRVGLDRGRVPAAGAYRAFSAMFGAENIFLANTEDAAADQERWITLLQQNAPAWAFGSGGGGNSAVASLGLQGEFKSATSADVARARAGFYLLFGSYFLEWQQPDNLLRATLAAPNGGLGAAWSGRPSFILHPLGLGQPLAEGIRLTQNNTTLYYSPANAYRRGVHIAWLGDPTLRLEYTAPISGLTGSWQNGTVQLAWNASPDAEAGGMAYVVYRAAAAEGPYARVSAQAVTTTQFIDRTPATGATYMVRAVRTHTTASGTYENPSQGVFWNTTAAPSDPPPPAPKPDAPVRFGLPLLFTPRSDAMGPRP
ncbi:fibronectin type III domain-containing protein [Opitutus sp. ER46]|uniref:fibronectin type III domain-containing protein n=1 Tax=Opitutus sp. ER46 TaxID=2161864 RepID=UPI001304CC74|nr:fibronectin type III domain-containing protein [Opitutus sp. ER46]